MVHFCVYSALQVRRVWGKVQPRTVVGWLLMYLQGQYLKTLTEGILLILRQSPGKTLPFFWLSINKHAMLRQPGVKVIRPSSHLRTSTDLSLEIDSNGSRVGRFKLCPAKSSQSLRGITSLQLSSSSHDSSYKKFKSLPEITVKSPMPK
jgi:hypothetical protein